MSVSAMLLQLLQAFGITAAIFALTLLGALPLGLPVALGRMSKCAPLRWLMSVYISVMRGTPLMLQLMVVYYGPGLLFHVSLPDNWRFLAVIVAFVINYAAYLRRSTGAASSLLTGANMKLHRCWVIPAVRPSSGSSCPRWCGAFCPR